MIRKFTFEAEIYESLNCLPMAARRKLDAVGIKLHLAQWEQLGRGERLMICHAPVDSEEEQSALKTFIEEVALARTNSRAKLLSDEVRRSANPPDHPPHMLVQQARAFGIELNDTAWATFDDDQRYTLIKLGDSEKPSHNLEPALQEFFQNSAQTLSQLRIFSYLPNPRIWKATIVARLAGVDVDLRGASPKELQSWLWDFEARPLSAADGKDVSEVSGHAGFRGKLHKTTAFLQTHPFGTVPAAFSSDGKVGIFESNSIMRAVARLGDARLGLYGRDPYESSRIDSFLDASLVFARDSQIYLLALGSGSLSDEIYHRTREAFGVYMAGIDSALSAGRGFIVGDRLTLADVCFVAEFALFHNEKTRAQDLKKRGLDPILNAKLEEQFPNAIAHFARISMHPAFTPDMAPYLQKIERATV